jgi:NAD-dependent deacetylase
MKVRSTGHGQEVFKLTSSNYEVNLGDCCPKKFQLRPHIVRFGEAVPEIETAERLVEEADVLVIIGTSLQVIPTAGLLHNLF